MQSSLHKHLVTIQDATPETQAWVDRFIAAARAGTGNWPHAHQTIPMTVVPLATFERVMASVGWTATPAGPVERHPHGDDPVHPQPGPSDGSAWHDALHGMLGDFH
ncbi:MAG TPA: hypothetical protein VES42_10110 [Pilimelia sp.]|nr:hypothetical protein [Pilimelia sp.]